MFYNYITFDNREFKQKYSYTGYYGLDFLKEFMCIREGFINDIGMSKELFNKASYLFSYDNQLLINKSLNLIGIKELSMEKNNIDNWKDRNNSSEDKNSNYETKEILDFAAKKIVEGENSVADALLSKIIQSFEVHKKIFNSYNYNFKPINKDHYKNVSLYVYFAFIVSLLYFQNDSLKYFNVILKINDTLCSIKEEVKDDKDIIYAYLSVKLEREAIMKLIERKGLTLS